MEKLTAMCDHMRNPQIRVNIGSDTESIKKVVGFGPATTQTAV